MVETISQERAKEDNYDSEFIKTPVATFNTYYDLGSLYNKKRSSLAPNGKFHTPRYWAPPVYDAILNLLAINSKIEFVDIKEENSKLVLNFHYPDDYDSRISTRVYEVKNLIDRLVHARLRHMKAARSFHHAVHPHQIF